MEPHKFLLATVVKGKQSFSNQQINFAILGLTILDLSINFASFSSKLILKFNQKNGAFLRNKFCCQNYLWFKEYGKNSAKQCHLILSKVCANRVVAYMVAAHSCSMGSSRICPLCVTVRQTCQADCKQPNLQVKAIFNLAFIT